MVKAWNYEPAKKNNNNKTKQNNNYLNQDPGSAEASWQKPAAFQPF